jgi:hypothetical protein
MPIHMMVWGFNSRTSLHISSTSFASELLSESLS